jgi:uncharacterized membrane protein
MLGKPLLSLPFLLIILGGTLIDVDHIFDEVYKGNIKKVRKVIRHWAKTCNIYVRGLYFFHTYEFMFVILLASIFLYQPFIYVLLGMIIHFLSDGITNYSYIEDFSWLKHYSVIWWLLSSL